MTYQIVYVSPREQVQKVAQALWEILPEGSLCAPLQEGQTPQADVQLVGFELQYSEEGVIPGAVLEYLKTLSGKTVFLFAAVPLRFEAAYTSRLHRAAADALPRECDYRGLHLCPSEPSETALSAFREHAEKNPDNTRVRHWLGRQEQAVGHPDERDLEEACSFALHVLKL